VKGATNVNEPTEEAQKVTGKVTAGQLYKLVRDGGRVGLSGEATYNRASYSDSFVFNFRVTRKAFKKRAETSSEVRVPGWVTNGYDSKRERTYTSNGSNDKCMHYTETYRPTGGFWYLYSADMVRDLLQLLPSDAEVSFQVYLDAGTNEYLVQAGCAMPYERYEGLHADHLYLHATKVVRGKRKEWHFLVDTTCGAHNSARFGYGNRP
jgi:hypothetical protein